MKAPATQITSTKFVLAGMAFLCCALLAGCKDSSEERAAAESQCQQLAASSTGFRPAAPAGADSTGGKGAAVGAVGGAAVGAATAKKGKTSKKAVQGAAVGAAAGAGVAALSDSEKKKAAAELKAAYDREYRNCLHQKGF
jgi:outer membrane lipoprotein SlyB